MEYPFFKVQFIITANSFYKNIGFRTMPLPVNIITITKSNGVYSYINVLLCKTLQVYFSKEDLLIGFAIPIKNEITQAPPTFNLEGDLSLLSYPVCILNHKYGVFVTGKILETLGLDIIKTTDTHN